MKDIDTARRAQLSAHAGGISQTVSQLTLFDEAATLPALRHPEAPPLPAIDRSSTARSTPNAQSPPAFDVEQVVALAATSFRLSDRDRTILRTLLLYQPSSHEGDASIRLTASLNDLSDLAGLTWKQARTAIKKLEGCGVVTSRQAVSGGKSKEYIVRLGVVRGTLTSFGNGRQLSLEAGRAQDAATGAPGTAGGRAQAAGLGAPVAAGGRARIDSPSSSENLAGRAHAQLIELNESKNHSITSAEQGRARTIGAWAWTPEQLGDHGFVDATIIPAAIIRFRLPDSEVVGEGIAAAACAARGSGGLFTRLVETRAWERTRARHRGDTWIAEKWFQQARDLRRPPKPSEAAANPSGRAVAQSVRAPVVERQLDSMSDQQIAALVKRIPRDRLNAAVHFQLNGLRSAADIRRNAVVRKLLLDQLESERQR